MTQTEKKMWGIKMTYLHGSCIYGSLLHKVEPLLCEEHRSVLSVPFSTLLLHSCMLYIS